MNIVKSLKFLYLFQAGLGVILTLWGTFFLAVMSTDAPSGTMGRAVVTGAVTFVVLFALGVLLPLAAIRELERYPRDRKLLWNWVDVLPMVFFFFPFALWQVYVLWKIPRMPEESWPESKRNEKDDQEEESDSEAYVERRLRELSRDLDDSDRR